METDQTIEWLLEEDNPSVRYFTLVDLLDSGPTAASPIRTIFPQSCSRASV